MDGGLVFPTGGGGMKTAVRPKAGKVGKKKKLRKKLICLKEMLHFPFYQERKKKLRLE